jgi:phenylalanyl-tRNA synthetase beta subunit
MRVWIWSGVIAVLLAISVTASMVWLSGHHLVKTDKGLVVVPKRFVGLKGTRVDIRSWTWADAVAHPDVSRALIKAGYEELLPQPPPEPTAMERAAEKARELRDEAAAAGSNAWQKVKAKADEWKKDKKPDVPPPSLPNTP